MVYIWLQHTYLNSNIFGIGLLNLDINRYLISILLDEIFKRWKINKYFEKKTNYQTECMDLLIDEFFFL